jgi:hypothetical protein
MNLALCTIPYRDNRMPLRWKTLVWVFSCCFFVLQASGGERLLVQLKDFEQTEVRSGGFTLPADARIHIYALGGGGEKGVKFSQSDLFAYGWIINADTRELVWKMDRDNTSREDRDRKFDGEITLLRGSYEVYFTAYAFATSSAFGSFNINIDRRKDYVPTDKKRGLFSWFEDFFGGDMKKEWKRRSKQWGIEVSAINNPPDITMFNPPKEFPFIFYKAVRLGENEHIRQGFTLSKPLSIRIYALGEIASKNEAADYGWIVDVKTRKRVWEMGRENLDMAGGDEKNVKFDRTVEFSSGEYILYYNTDDSHSYVDWNAQPPDDPLNYGITLLAKNDGDRANFKLSTPKEDQNIIVQLTRVGNNETRTSSFTLKEDTRVHVYALGERGNSRRQMADYGWIVNVKTREKVWTMDVDKSEHAGGADKNRLIDEVIPLPKGTYTVYYQTDDSHAYNDWNSTPPFDPEHWGITISGVGENFNSNIVEKNITPKEVGVVAQIVRVGNHANMTQQFRIDKTTHVRVYAIGEGQDREMYDYGWIENASNGNVVWEMTYSMTFHAGGGRKNRMVNTTILLDKGEYKLHYTSDDSHSFGHWNTDPPDDPTMWGITLYEEK